MSDRILFNIIMEVVDTVSDDYATITKFFKERSKELGIKDDYARKLEQGNLSWRVFLQGISLLDMKDVTITVTFRYKVEVDVYSKKKKIVIPIMDPGKRHLGYYSLRDITDGILECVAKDGVHQTIFINKTRYYYSNFYPDLSAKGVEDKTRNILRRLQSTSFSWSTFLELLDILEAKDATIRLAGTIGEKKKFKGKAFTVEVK